MLRSFSLALLLIPFLFGSTARAQEVTGLAGWSIFLDPGHYQMGNVGVFGYSEAHKVLRIGLALQDMLLEQTDIDTVFISRTNDQQVVSLQDRVLLANLSGASYFHSIHSNAAAPSANFVFVLWPQHRTGEEVSPQGGKKMAEIMSGWLGRGMRIPSQGGYGECDFYGTGNCRLPGATDPSAGGGKGGSRNYVQSYTNMASALSEAGFHTNPTQNQRNMNAEWKRLEAQVMFWSILDFHGLERPKKRIVTGIVSDADSRKPLNGVLVQVGDATYRTDTHKTLFERYSTDPEALSNGFYYLEDVPEGPLPVSATLDRYTPFSGEVVPVDTFFTFVDMTLVSTVPPRVVASIPAEGQTAFRVLDDIVLDFSRKMDRSLTETAFSIDPSTTGRFIWSQQDFRLTFRPDSLEPETAYVVTLGESARGVFGHGLDGDGNGEEGGFFVLSFQTGFRDVQPPRVTASFPRLNATGVDLQPILNFVYDEEASPDAFQGRVRLEKSNDGSQVAGTFRHYVVQGRSVLSYFPATELEPATGYRLVIDAGVSDLFGNADPTSKTLRFTTGTERYAVRSIEPFEPGFTSHWWAPQQSGSTRGIRTELTAMSADTSVVNLLTGSRLAMRLDYAWDLSDSSWLIREYLGSGPAYATTFTADDLLQAYVFGDGSRVLFRFAVDDKVPVSAAVNHEVSPWIEVDWFGWRLVTWDMRKDGTGVWLGDGVVDGTARFDSFQLTRSADGASAGTLFFDDLRTARRVPVGTDAEAEGPGAMAFAMRGNYPNPFGQSTTLAFDLDRPGSVSLTVYDALGRSVGHPLVATWLEAGRRQVEWDAGSLAGGVYLVRLVSDGRESTARILLVR